MTYNAPVRGTCLPVKIAGARASNYPNERSE